LATHVTPRGVWQDYLCGESTSWHTLVVFLGRNKPLQRRTCWNALRKLTVVRE